MKTFLEEANHGVIYVSLGSVIEPSYFMELGNTFIRELKKFPQRVVMKWDPKLLTEIPENILVEEWIPQTEVLSKIFVKQLLNNYLLPMEKYWKIYRSL